MKKRTILLLQKIDKMEKNRAIAEYSQSISSFNKENRILESQRENMRKEISLEDGIGDELFGAQYISNWKFTSVRIISAGQSKLESCARDVEASRLNLQAATKKATRYDNLS